VATVHEAKWCAQRNRRLEATGVRSLMDPEAAGPLPERGSQNGHIWACHPFQHRSSALNLKTPRDGWVGQSTRLFDRPMRLASPSAVE
jgi:hypothetical protein